LSDQDNSDLEYGFYANIKGAFTNVLGPMSVIGDSNCHQSSTCL